MWYWPGTGTLWTSPYFFGGREFRATGNGAIGIYTRSSVALPSQKGPFFERFDVEAGIGLKLTNFRFVRRADLYAKRSESPVSALCVEMCMAQHFLLSAPGVD
jgi:hypothetical protein